jgi:hypothetical protein
VLVDDTYFHAMDNVLLANGQPFVGKHKPLILRPNKIKVLVLRQRRPLKISADGTFLLPYRKKIAATLYF